MKHLLFDTKDGNFLKKKGKGKTEKYSKAHAYTQEELDSDHGGFSEQLRTGINTKGEPHGVVKIPLENTPQIDQFVVLYVSKGGRKEYWRSPGMGITESFEGAYVYSRDHDALEHCFASTSLFAIPLQVTGYVMAGVTDEVLVRPDALIKSNFKSTKVFDGFSTVFRQHKAEDTHCRFLHGYAVSFKVTFEGDLDERNWVFDFGGMKRANTKIDGMTPKAWMDYMFDHTVILAEDDPELNFFRDMDGEEVVQLRIIPATGAEQFAKYIYEKLNKFVKIETKGRVKVTQVEFMENQKNSAIYGE